MISISNAANLVFNTAALHLLVSAKEGPTGRHLREVCIDVEGEAKRLTNNVMVNVQTGRLSGSITHVVTEEQGDLVGYVGSNVEYAKYVHDGTGRMGARPFLTTALETVLG